MQVFSHKRQTQGDPFESFQKRQKTRGWRPHKLCHQPRLNASHVNVHEYDERDGRTDDKAEHDENAAPMRPHHANKGPQRRITAASPQRHRIPVLCTYTTVLRVVARLNAVPEYGFVAGSGHVNPPKGIWTSPDATFCFSLRDLLRDHTIHLCVNDKTPTVDGSLNGNKRKHTDTVGKNSGWSHRCQWCQMTTHTMVEMMTYQHNN
jgi:hypothetical protein